MGCFLGGNGWSERGRRGGGLVDRWIGWMVVNWMSDGRRGCVRVRVRWMDGVGGGGR